MRSKSFSTKGNLSLRWFVMGVNSISSSSRLSLLLPVMELDLEVDLEVLVVAVAPPCCFLRSNMLKVSRFCFFKETSDNKPINKQKVWSRIIAIPSSKSVYLQLFISNIASADSDSDSAESPGKTHWNFCQFPVSLHSSCLDCSPKVQWRHFPAGTVQSSIDSTVCDDSLDPGLTECSEANIFKSSVLRPQTIAAVARFFSSMPWSESSSRSRSRSRSVIAAVDAMPLVIVLVIDASTKGRVGNGETPNSNANTATKHDPMYKIFGNNGEVCRRWQELELELQLELLLRGDDSGVVPFTSTVVALPSIVIVNSFARGRFIIFV